MPFFSVVIPVYNKESFVKKTIESALSQSFEDFEIIIVNDGSTDQSLNILESFKDARIKIFTINNSGASSARNFGIEKSSGKFIAFLDADDYWYPDFLKSMSFSIEKFHDIKIHAAAIEVDTGKKIIASSYSIDQSKDIQVVDYFESSQKESSICTSSAVFAKEVFEEIGNFDTSIKSGQDTDLWIRMGLKYKLAFTSKILARYIFDGKSLSKEKLYASKLNFEKFRELEKENSRLKMFLDLNRFSIAIKAKINDDYKVFLQLYSEIDKSKLPLKKYILLNLPAAALKKLINLKKELAENGIGSSVFK